jgi:hypothetical protein
MTSNEKHQRKTLNEIEIFYDKNEQYEWERLERHRTEFAVTLRALEDYLPSAPAQVLDAGFTSAYFADSEGFETLDFIACEGVVSMIEEKVNELTSEVFDAWVELNYKLGKDPSVHGAAEHLLYVGRKRLENEAQPLDHRGAYKLQNADYTLESPTEEMTWQPRLCKPLILKRSVTIRPSTRRLSLDTWASLWSGLRSSQKGAHSKNVVRHYATRSTR